MDFVGYCFFDCLEPILTILFVLLSPLRTHLQHCGSLQLQILLFVLAQYLCRTFQFCHHPLDVREAVQGRIRKHANVDVGGRLGNLFVLIARHGHATVPHAALHGQLDYQ